jgi:mono/diheme cytochrome c family protein
MRLLFFLFMLGLALAGCTGPAKATDAPQDERSAARKLYVAKCAKCHKFYDPAKYSDEDWQMWMRKMGKKSKLKLEQQEMLSRYIEDTYRSPAKTNTPARKP